jgi:hypothetical protein
MDRDRQQGHADCAVAEEHAAMTAWPLDPETRAKRIAEHKAELRFMERHHQTVGARVTELKAILKTIYGEASDGE